MKPKLIAFYLPQYHPIPENDLWWGRGFTDWNMAAKARPIFPGHYQPHLPADLGFYDLRLEETRLAQAELARQYGIHGFCYYHYWFQGRQLLERPFREVLSNGRPDLPFCLCWANESWARTWDGRSDHVLLGQTYSLEDDRAHMQWLAAAFVDPRYLRLDGKPVFLVYNASGLPDPVATTTVWREEAARLGLGDLWLCKVESHRDNRSAPRSQGFDAAVSFEPNTAVLLTPVERAYWRIARRLNLLKGALIVGYADWAARSLRQPPAAYTRYPCVTPSWDNSARRESGAFVLHGSTPQRYGQWLRSVVGRPAAGDEPESLVFVNAWNEWGEGNHLEPCQRWGRGYLEATLGAMAAGDAATGNVMVTNGVGQPGKSPRDLP